MRQIILILGFFLISPLALADSAEQWHESADAKDLGRKLSLYIDVETKAIGTDEAKVNAFFGNLFVPAMQHLTESDKVATFSQTVSNYAWDHYEGFCLSTHKTILNGLLAFLDFKRMSNSQHSSDAFKAYLDLFLKVNTSKVETLKIIDKLVNLVESSQNDISFLKLFLQRVSIKAINMASNSNEGVEDEQVDRILAKLIEIENYTVENPDKTLSKYLKEKARDKSGKKFSTTYLLTLSAVRVRGNQDNPVYKRIWSEMDRHFPTLLTLLGSNVEQFQQEVGSKYNEYKNKNRTESALAIASIRSLYKKSAKILTGESLAEDHPKFLQISAAKEWLIEIIDSGKLKFEFF